MVSLWPGAVKTEYIQVLISCHISFHVKLKIIQTFPQDKILNVETKNPMKAAFEKGQSVT